MNEENDVFQHLQYASRILCSSESLGMPTRSLTASFRNSAIRMISMMFEVIQNINTPEGIVEQIGIHARESILVAFPS
jgi:hypothetical protein